MKLRMIFGLLLAAPLALGVAGCGKRPDFPIPPGGKGSDGFPHLYPNPIYDPQPGATKAPSQTPAEAASGGGMGAGTGGGGDIVNGPVLPGR